MPLTASKNVWSFDDDGQYVIDYNFKRNYFTQLILRCFTKKEIHESFKNLTCFRKKTHKKTEIEIRPNLIWKQDVIFIVLEWQPDNSTHAATVLTSENLQIDDDDYEFGNAFAKRLNLFGDAVL